MKEGEIMQKKNQIELKYQGNMRYLQIPLRFQGGEKTSYIDTNL